MLVVAVLTGFSLVTAQQARGDASGQATAESAGQRESIPLDSGWTLERSGTTTPISLGDSWETDGFRDFDGRGIYRTNLVATAGVKTSGRWLLEVDGAATAAEVRINGQPIASHLGGWTPFRMDVTEWMHASNAASPADKEVRLEIEVDERVGHNTQGFLPIVVPHFGGIWKGVRLIRTSGSMYLDDMTLRLSGFDGGNAITVEAQVRGPEGVSLEGKQVGVRIVGPLAEVRSDWKWFPILREAERGKGESVVEASGTDHLLGVSSGSIVPPVIRRWRPESPFLYDVEIAIRDSESGVLVDRIGRRAALRHFATDGRRLLVNGEPVKVRGVLNWGYAPPRIAPSIDEAEMRRELEFARQRGFNLMKFCLWLPPRRYLELADEMGMLTWIEYPTWHPDFSAQRYLELRTEFAEFFHYDRNQASVLLRSLTCETGHGASIDVIQGLYDLGHATIPGAIIEDDSSWIGWHRVHDFYDDHPYGNNHTWLQKLAELDDHIADRQAKPLLLGEAIAADTWEPSGPQQARLNSRHRALSCDAQADYISTVLSHHRLSDAERIRVDSYRYALAMRKYQVEAFRWRLPDAGYVVSVIRDFPKASMGLIDRFGVPKWTEEQFAWQGPIQLVLQDGQAVRSVAAGQDWTLCVGAVGEGDLPGELSLLLELRADDQSVVTSARSSGMKTERDDQVVFAATLPTPSTDTPLATELHATLYAGDNEIATNHWRAWLIPQRDGRDGVAGKPLYASDALSTARREELGLTGSRIVGNVADANRLLTSGLNVAPPVILADRFDAELMETIERGGRCVMLVDGQPRSWLTANHWFLRGGPIVADHPIIRRLNAEMLVDLQTMDLAGPVMVDFPLLQEGTPLFSLWDNHDLDHYRTHALLWEARVGAGLLVCSSLNHGPGSGVAGRYVLEEMLEHAAQPITARRMTLKSLAALRSQITQQQVSIADQPWYFRRASGSEVNGESVVETHWLAESTTEDPNWSRISVTSHWDGQGHGDLDGWGFYRTTVAIPEDWTGETLYVAFTGVDDYFEVFADGQRIGSGGDLVNRETAFELRTSFVIPDSASADGTLELGVCVYDWQGAGGIFRPVYLSTQPLNEGKAWLVPE